MPLFANRISDHTRSRAETSLANLNLKSDKDVVRYVQERWRKRDQYRFAIERQWMINVAMYLGHQHLEFSELTRTLQEPPQPPWRVRLTTNLLMGISRKIVSKVLRQRPQWVVVPATEETEDELTALVSEKILRHYWHVNQMDESLVEAITWMTITGNVFLRCFWDTTKGEEFEVTPADVAGPFVRDREKRGKDFFKKFQKDKRKKPPDKLRTRLGDVTVEVCSPFEIDPDPTAKRWCDIRELIQTKLRSQSYMKDHYGVTIPKITEEEHNSSFHFQQQMSALGGPGFIGQKEQDPDTVLEHTLYVKPTVDYPRGHFAVVAGGEILRKGELELGQIPFVHLREVPVPARLWGTCVIEQSIPLQVGYNRARSQVIENVNLMSRPKWLVPEQSGTLESNFTSEPGEIIEHVPGLEPKMVTPPPVPNYVVENLNNYRNDMRDVTSLHEVSNAQVPGGVRAGVAIAQLQEQDDSVLAPMLMTLEDSLSRLGQWVLKLTAANVTEDRLIKITGKHREVETLTFKGKDLLGKKHGKPGVNFFDVQVQMGSQLPFSKAARQQFVIEMVQFGILRPQENKMHEEKVLEMLELGTDAPIIDDGHLERANVHRENLELLNMKQGEFLPINPWDMDELHIEEHRSFQRTPDYRRIAEQRPWVADTFEEHIQAAVTRASGQAPPPGLPGAPTEIQPPPPEPQEQLPMTAGAPDPALLGLAELIASQEGTV